MRRKYNHVLLRGCPYFYLLLLLLLLSLLLFVAVKGNLSKYFLYIGERNFKLISTYIQAYIKHKMIRNLKKKIENVIGVIRSIKSMKGRQYNGQKKKGERTKNDIQNVVVLLLTCK